MLKFKDLDIGDTFFLGGSIWVKKSSRTAWNKNMTQWFYFGLNESVSRN